MAAIPRIAKRGLTAPSRSPRTLSLRSAHSAFSRSGILDLQAISRHAKTLIDRFDIRPPREQYLATSLGGNQQKVILARKSHAIGAAYRVAADKGLDVGAIEYVRKDLSRFATQGKLFSLSLDLDETLSRRPYRSHHEGRIVAVLDRKRQTSARSGFSWQEVEQCMSDEKGSYLQLRLSSSLFFQCSQGFLSAPSCF